MMNDLTSFCNRDNKKRASFYEALFYKDVLFE